MPEPLQQNTTKHKKYYKLISNLLRKNNIQPDTIDIDAEIDSSLTYNEVKQHFIEQYHLTKNQYDKQHEQALIDTQKQQIEEQKRAYLEELFKNQSVSLQPGNTTDILKEISAFSPNVEAITLSSLLAVNQGQNIINVGNAGIGKSRCTKELLEMLDIPVSLIVGHHSPKQLFNELKNAKSVVIIDEGQGIFRDYEALNLLLTALWERRLVWQEEEVKLDCWAIIFNINHLPTTPFLEAITDRCIVNDLHLSNDKIREKVISSFSYKPTKELWNLIKQRIFIKSELTPEETDKVKQMMEVMNIKSVRDKGKILKTACFCKSLFNDFSFVAKYYNLFVEGVRM